MWILSGHFASQVIRLGGNLIMTRILVPEMFGVMAVANILIMGLQLCSYFGVQHNIIQSHRGDDPLFLNTAWTFQILRGGIIFLLAISLAAGLAIANSFGLVGASSAYHDPVLPSVLAALSFTALISGFESTNLASAHRVMRQGRITILELISQVAGLAVMIVWALVDKSIWALVGGTILSSCIKTILSHWYIEGQTNRLMWNRDIFLELFAFGKWILLTTILGYFVSNGDRLVLAGLVKADVLGVYTIALFMISALQEVLSKLATNAALPALSKVVRERREDLSAVYYKIRFPIDLAILFICGLLFYAGHLITDVLYDNRYANAGHMLEILAISLFGIRYVLSENVFIALGKPRLLIPAQIFQLLITFSVIAPIYNAYGLDGAIWIIALTPLLALPIRVYFMAKYGFLNLKRELYVLPALPAGLAIGALVNMLAQHFVSMSR
ncbi:oligosaccharide flippase family protein [Sideroxydans sp. CL21]|uniref:oligosaccharide flippase family protein n=1 Tax=Sideroxydans sp. CL21 TaxID=2600596 RepID=UPI0024BD5C82|nr:oligosaccharide flippase family protein [Sideroxydans sp. CL21]